MSAEIRLPVPPAVHDELTKIATGRGYRSLEDWTRSLLVQAAENTRPALRDSGMWARDTSKWYDQLGDQQ